MIRIIFLFFCFYAFLSLQTTSAQTPSKQAKVVIGKFAGIEQGDYSYFTIIKDDKTEMSFRVDKTDALYEKVEKNPKSFIGKKVKVYYKHQKIYTPEAGGEVEVDLYVKAEWVK